MWKVSFNKDSYKKVEVLNGKATVVTLTAKIKIPEKVAMTIPAKMLVWMIGEHTNPKVEFDVFSGIITLKAKDKTVRKDEDEDKPLLAERLAECRAKMRIYKLMIALTEQYSKYYMEILLGKSKVLYPTKDSSKPDKDSVWGANVRYGKLWDREYKLCIKLQEELGRWD